MYEHVFDLTGVYKNIELCSLHLRFFHNHSGCRMFHVDLNLTCNHEKKIQAYYRVMQEHIKVTT